MNLLNQLNLASIPIYDAQIPAEGPKAVPINLDFTSGTGEPSYTLDLNNFQTQGFISMVQTLFIDNSAGTQPIIVTVTAARGQILQAPPGSQGYYPILSPNPAQLQFACSDTSNKAQVILINVGIAPGVWLV